MDTPLAPPLRTADLIQSSHDDRDLRRRAEHGHLVRLVPGSYVEKHVWSRLAVREQYVVTIRAVVERLPERTVVSQWSAAAVWGFTVPDVWPEVVEVIDPARRSATRTASVRRRPGEFDVGDVADWSGVRVTSPARTAADIALSNPFASAVVVFDHGLNRRLFTREQVEACLADRPSARRLQTARAALAFASEKAEYPGESFSRIGMAQRGFPAPTLQKEFRDRTGSMFVDFWWAEFGIAGEFDGEWKYSDERFLKGRTPGQAVADEKRRQNRLDAAPGVQKVVRWDYAVARNPDELARRLGAAGLPRLRIGRRQGVHAAD